jgi:CTP synthase
MFCHVQKEQVVGVHDVSSVYHVPLLLQSQGIVGFLQRRLNLSSIPLTPKDLERGASLETRWKALTGRCVRCSFAPANVADTTLQSRTPV